MIYTADSARSIKQAIAFSGNTILVVGDDSDMEKLIDTKVLATYLDGRLVYSAAEDEGAWWDQREARMRDWLHRD